MLVELNYVFFSLLPAVYSAWHYFKIREKHLLYLTSCFTFLTLSAMLEMFRSAMWVYSIQVNVVMLRLLQLGGLAFFACFTISSIMALKTILRLPTRKNDENFSG